uniref:Uncharacterized protein n=1 Tax=Ditylenchus dipsaci TaxID=166011 RepID=A0A915DQ25_9BILA
MTLILKKKLILQLITTGRMRTTHLHQMEFRVKRPVMPVNLTSPGAKSSKFSTELDRLDETLNDQGLDGKEIEKVSDDEIMQNVFSDVIVAGHKADDADVFDTVTDYSHFSDVLKDPSRADFWGCAEWGRKNSGSFFAEEEFLETEQKGAEH